MEIICLLCGRERIMHLQYDFRQFTVKKHYMITIKSDIFGWKIMRFCAIWPTRSDWSMKKRFSWEKVIVIGKNGLYCHYMILHRLENTSVYIGRKMSHFLRRQRRLILQYIMQVLFGINRWCICSKNTDCLWIRIGRILSFVDTMKERSWKH